MKRRSLFRTLGAGASALAVARGPGLAGLSMLVSGAASAQVRFGRGKTRIALLLPDSQGPFRRAADAVLGGVRAAHGVDGTGIAVEVFDVDDERTDMAGLFERLAGRGFGLAIGPMTRASVNRLGELAAVPLPVLALNVPDPGYRLPPNCIQFGIPIEDEGRQIARFAMAQARQRTGAVMPRALAIADQASSLAQRGARAFLDAWRDEGGESYDILLVEASMLYDLGRIVAGAHAEAAFIGLAPHAVPAAREALGQDMPLYGTSQLDIGAIPGSKAGEMLAMPALDGLHIVEMPWEVERGHPTVLTYPRAENMPHLELQRLYAFGIDAYRVGRELLAGNDDFQLDGVTGWLRLDALTDTRVHRLATICVYREGMLVPVEFPPPDTPQPADGQPGPRDEDAGRTASTGDVQAPAAPGTPMRPDAPPSPARPDAPASPGELRGFVPVPRPAPAPSGFVPGQAPGSR